MPLLAVGDVPVSPAVASTIVASVSGCFGMPSHAIARCKAALVVERMACLPECKPAVLLQCLPALVRILVSIDVSSDGPQFLESVANTLWLLVELPGMKSHRTPAHLRQYNSGTIPGVRGISRMAAASGGRCSRGTHCR